MTIDELNYLFDYFKYNNFLLLGSVWIEFILLKLKTENTIAK